MWTLLQFNRNETRYTDKDWAPDEIAAFEDAIGMHGAELRAVREEVSTRTMPEVVRFYGHWKKYVSHPSFYLHALRSSLLPLAPSSARRTRASARRASAGSTQRPPRRRAKPRPTTTKAPSSSRPGAAGTPAAALAARARARRGGRRPRGSPPRCCATTAARAGASTRTSPCALCGTTRRHSRLSRRRRGVMPRRGRARARWRGRDCALQP